MIGLRKILTLRILTLLVVMAVGCSLPGDGTTRGGSEVSPEQGVPSRQIPIEPRNYWGVAWLPGNWLVVEIDPDPQGTTVNQQLWRMRPDGSDLQRLKLPEEAGCRITEYVNPTRLPDGRLGVLRQCYKDYRLLTRPFAYDLRSETLTPLMAVDLEAVLFRAYSWDPSLQRGISSDSSLICATLIWLTPDGISYPSFGLVDGARSFIIDERLAAPGEADCEGQPRADWPAWSPDGETIAFFFSPESADSSGQGRLDAPWDLYLMDPETLQPVKHLSGLNGAGAHWSPDSEWLLLYTGPGGKPAGLWLYQPATRALELARMVRTRGKLGGAWSPDGTEIAVIAGGTFSQEHITIYDVSELVGP